VKLERITEIIDESLQAIESLKADLVNDIHAAAKAIASALKKGKRVYAIGNGGSAADAQHFAGELVGRFRMDRKAMSVAALTTDTSILTSISNDYGFQAVFSKQLEGLLHKGDVVLCISTSGNSPNIVGALMVARELGAITVGLTGRDGGKMKGLCHRAVIVPNDSTPRIQEAHGLIIHILCELVEEELFGQGAVFAGKRTGA